METSAHLCEYLAELFLDWKMFQNRTENQSTHFIVGNIFFRKPCRLWDDVESYCRGGQATDDDVTRRMRVACWIAEATKAHSEYIILIAFPLQQWLHRHFSLLRHTYIACIVVLEL